ncbi:hypothetical protein DERP_007549 [Dermatophagoides pteronyssinus]|uniref:Uncharacterized protein n=1 Tax=Dermatophagoides pteronyssinus TaxID=6956 RepID=A0ABQ8JKJ4_DERPT|nr:hypothetical protein DERP_007549 [Dermatophagoides pteronyssinus]
MKKKKSYNNDLTGKADELLRKADGLLWQLLLLLLLLLFVFVSVDVEKFRLFIIDIINTITIIIVGRVRSINFGLIMTR